ncbi:MAG: Flp pilus assembly protein TadB, partial [Saprospiraceae bacterium]
MNSHQQRYQQRANDFAKTAENLQAKFQKFSLVRLLVFTIGVGISAFIGAKFGVVFGFIVAILALLGFAQFVFWHLRIQQNQRHQAALSQINENELAYLNKDYVQFANGEAYLDAAHPYTIDLDIFGDYSFFQYTSRASTIIGQNRYADYLQKNTMPTEILNRQEATTELREKMEWRQNLQAHGLATEDDLEHLKLLETWLKDEPFVLPNKGYQLAIWLVPIWFILSILIAIFYLPNMGALLLLLPQV